MNKYYGAIGFAETTESSDRPGIWNETITERNYYGDILRSSRRLQGSGQVNSDVIFSHTISIVSDPYAVNNFGNMRYLTYGGSKWKIDSIEVQYPRLLLTTGGLYNGQ